MEHVVLVIHLILTLALIILILLQRSEGGGLGLGTSGGLGGLASPQSTANALTKATTFVAICFFATSLILAIMASRGGQSSSILDAVVDNPPAAASSTSPEGEKTGINSESSQAPAAAAPGTPKEAEKPKTVPAVPRAD